MDPRRWEQVEALFHGAVELPPAARAAHVRSGAAGDEELIAEVHALLDADTRTHPGLDGGVSPVADDLLGSEHHPLPAQSFGPYRAIAFLGEGGMGVVYLAERSDLESRAAIKILRDAVLTPARRERFLAEQRTLAQLSHASIAQLHDAGSLPDGTPWFAMGVVDGKPLTEYCREHSTSVEGRLELFRTVCEAVQHAHAHAVIHRDLKPSNILVQADGTVKLLDFGIAKNLQELEAQSERTITAMRVMTPAYAAPEQLSDGRIGIHTDIYSLGVILYELLTQRLPFDTAGLAPAAAAMMLRTRTPDRPSLDARRGVRARSSSRTSWADLDVLCLTAMHCDPERRYETTAALIRDIDHYLASEPLDARPDTVGYRLGKFVRRNRAGVTAAGVALAALLSLGAYHTSRLRTMRDAALAEAARTSRIHGFMLSLFDGGDADSGPAEDLRVSSLLERGVQEAGALEDEPLVQADLIGTLGSLYRKLGEFERADDLLGRALDTHVGLLGNEHERTAEALVSLGLLRLDEARYEEAEELVRRALTTLEHTVTPAHPGRARASVALGRVQEARGDYKAAIVTNEEAVRLSALRGEDSLEHLTALGQLADSHYYSGHYELADELNERVLEGVRRIFGERHPRVADVLVNLGASQHDRGRYEQSEPCYRRALVIIEEFYGLDHYRTASAATMLGRTLVAQKRFDEAEPLLERALSIQERVNGPVHPRVASTLNDLGSLALLEGDLDHAEDRFRRVLSIYENVYEGEHPFQATARSNLASVLVRKEDYAPAEALYRSAIGIFERTRGSTHIDTGIARIKLGRALLRQERWAEAAEESSRGYEVVQSQAAPSVSWLRSARADLVSAFEALGEPERAEAFRER